MNKVKVFTDSTADLSKDLLEKYNVSVVPLYVTIGEKSFRDGTDINTDEMYRMVDKLQVLPKTSTPTVEDFITAFQPWIQEGYDIVFIGISSKLSSAIQTASMAARVFSEGRIFIVDSLNLSTGIGLLVLRAAELAKEGLPAYQIVDEISMNVPKVRSSFIIDTLKYIHMGGRCSSIQLIAGSVLKIKPQIIVKDGGMVVGEKYRGKKRRVLDSFYLSHIGNGKQVDPCRVFVTHSAYQEGAEYLKKKLKENLDIDEILITEAGTVISSHCGPGTVGILYLEK